MGQPTSWAQQESHLKPLLNSARRERGEDFSMNLMNHLNVSSLTPDSYDQGGNDVNGREIVTTVGM